MGGRSSVRDHEPNTAERETWQAQECIFALSEYICATLWGLSLGELVEVRRGGCEGRNTVTSCVLLHSTTRLWVTA